MSEVNNQKKDSKQYAILIAVLFPWISIMSLLWKVRAVGAILSSKVTKREIDGVLVIKYLYEREMDWYKKFVKINLTAAALIFLISLSPLISGYMTYSNFGSSKIEKQSNLKKLFKQKKMPQGAKKWAYITICLLSASALSGYMAKLMNPVYKMSKKLDELLKSDGDKKRLKIWLPIGVYMDITGQEAKVIAQDDRIWASLNMNMDKDSYIENAKDRTKVLFVASFKLEDKYDYDEVKFSPTLVK